MMKIISLAVVLNLINVNCKAQIYIEPVAGFQYDLNNHNRYKQINTAVQLAYHVGTEYEFLIRLQKTWPLKYISGDSSFSTNPALPVYANAEKTIKASCYSFTLGHRFKITGDKSKNALSAVLYPGFTLQIFNVKYKYDKNNYIVLNPDKSIAIGGLFLSGGFEYMRKFKNSRFFTQLLITTPPARKIKYPASFGLMAPLYLNAGYSILIKEKKKKRKK
jgi:hypothetical protein